MNFMKLAKLSPSDITSALALVPESNLENMIDQVDWSLLSEYKQLSEEFMERHISHINWSKASYCQKLSKEFIRKHKDILDWKFIACDQELSLEFMIEHAELIDWQTYIEHRPIDDLDRFMELFKDHLHWWELCYNYGLNEQQLDLYSDYIEWEALSSNPSFTLSESVLPKYDDKLDFVEMDEHNPLSEAFKAQYPEHFAIN